MICAWLAEQMHGRIRVFSRGVCIPLLSWLLCGVFGNEKHDKARSCLFQRRCWLFVNFLLSSNFGVVALLRLFILPPQGVGHGTTMSLFIPVAAEQLARVPALSSSQEAFDGTVGLGVICTKPSAPKRVLLVDDT